MNFRGYLFVDWIGYIVILASANGIAEIKFTKELPFDASDEHINPHIELAKKQLTEYFNHRRTEFTLELDLSSGTDFQTSVWHQVSLIPYGQTTTYLNIAKALENEKAIRAVGAANGANPFPIVIPCHRVIASNGNLQGYAYGLETKRQLLMHENPEVFGIQNSLNF